MEIERGAADAAQQAAFANADVGEMVNGLMLYPENRTLLEVARESFIRPTPATRDVLSARLRVDARDPLVDTADAIAKAGARIRNAPDAIRELRKGALLERIVWSLVGRRPGVTGVSRETKVRLVVNPHSGASWTGRKDVVVNQALFEVFECKFSGGIAQWELDQLGDVWLTAEAEGTDARPCLATLDSMAQFQARMQSNGLEPHPKLYFAGLTDLPFLVVRPPSQQVA